MKAPFFLLVTASWTLVLAIAASQQDRSVNYGSFLSCGDGVAVCGVLTLESGLGKGNYHHRKPSVHGIWPQIGHYGSSQCVAPSRSSAAPSKLYPCYNASPDDDGSEMAFEEHEWKKHGVCAGVKDADDFFQQVCRLSKAPLAAMKEAVPFKEMVTSLRNAGFSIYRIDDVHEQVELTVCLAGDGKWVLAAPSDFPKLCGSGGGSKPTPSPTPSPHDAHGSCVLGRHGPPCKENKDCTSFADCLRCAHSGFCTAQPLVEEDRVRKALRLGKVEA